MSVKKYLGKLNKTLTIILVIAILGVINFISYQAFLRLDITETNEFSISSASKKIAGDLDDVVNIKSYFSKNLPSQLITLPQEVGDILDEYKNYSNGKIRVEFIDPGDDEEMKNKLMMSGIPPLQLNVMEKDKYQVVQGYLGMTIGYGDKTEAIPVIENTSQLEYQVSTAIKKVTSKDLAAVGYVTSNGTVDLKAASVAEKKLKELYNISEVDLADGEVDKSIKTLIIAGPKEKFSDKELKAIDNFTSNGGSLLVLLDGVKIGEGLAAEKNETGLEGLLEKYGIKVGTDLVLDRQAGVASFNQGFVTFSLEYPYWPKIGKAGFDKDVASVSNLEALILPWVSSVDTIKDKMDKENKVSHLVMSSDNGWRITEGFNLNPQAIELPAGGTGKFSLAVLASGNFISAYDAKRQFNSRIAVVGDSDFMQDGFLQNAPDNLVFFQNLTDALSLDEDLINIRSKGVSSRPVKELSEGAKAGLRYGNVFGITLIVIIIGTLRYLGRRRKRESEV